MRFAKLAKRFLNIWNYFILFLGVLLICTTLYVRVFEKDQYAIPSLAYNTALFSGTVLVIVSSIGIYGLHQHKKAVAKGRRNYALTTYVSIAGIASIFVLFAGMVALAMSGVVNDARAKEFGMRKVKYLEEAVIEKLAEYATDSSNDWKKIQNSLFCCGYYDPILVNDYLPDKFVDLTKKINNEAGNFCSKDCPNNQVICLKEGIEWCREAFLDDAYLNSFFIGAVSIGMGGSQIISFLLSLFILLCDVNGKNVSLKAPLVKFMQQVSSSDDGERDEDQDIDANASTELKEENNESEEKKQDLD